MAMDSWSELIGLAFRSLIGFGVLFGLLYYAVNTYSSMWRALEAYYGQTQLTPVITRKVPETIVITKSGYRGGLAFSNIRYTLYAWTIVSVLDDGLLLSAIPPVNWVCKPIFLPFDQMHVGRHPWNLWRDPLGLTMDKAGDLVVILGDDTAQWLRQYSDHFS